jgi:16S rRNA (guanine966-N2)-methyltransferase
VAAPVARALARPAPAPFDLVFADPPYALPDADLADVLTSVVEGGWAAPGAVVVVERSARGPAFPWPRGVLPARSRRYGEAMLWYGRAAHPERPQGD